LINDPVQIAVQVIPSLESRYSTISRLACGNRAKLTGPGCDVSPPYSLGMNRLTLGMAAAASMAVRWMAASKVATAEMMASWPWKAAVRAARSS
jgi:hypothetical protein